MGPAPAGPIGCFQPGVSTIGEDREMRRRVGASTRVAVVLTAVLVLATGCGRRDDSSAADPASGGAAVTATTASTTPTPTPTASGPEGVTDGCTTPAASPTTVAYAQVPGVDPNLMSVDVYGLPAGCGPAPVVFWVHGGGWSKGDKANEGTASKAAWAASHGWALVAVNYRLSVPGAGVVWPTHGRDVAAAVTYTLDHAEQFGIDPARVALMGHSAGAHIVSFLAVAPDQLAVSGREAPAVSCLVALDTEGYDLVDRVDTGPDITDEMIANAFGIDTTALVAASPLQTLQANRGTPPDAIVVTRGLPQRKAQANDFADALKAHGAEVTVVDATGYSHADVSVRLGSPSDTVVTPPVTTFLESCLA
jgi:acetyl esterase/lipase